MHLPWSRDYLRFYPLVSLASSFFLEAQQQYNRSTGGQSPSILSSRKRQTFVIRTFCSLLSLTSKKKQVRVMASRLISPKLFAHFQLRPWHQKGWMCVFVNRAIINPSPEGGKIQKCIFAKLGRFWQILKASNPIPFSFRLRLKGYIGSKALVSCNWQMKTGNVCEGLKWRQ